MESFLEKLSTHSKDALKKAIDCALSLGHKTITPQHVLYGLSIQKGSIASQILTKAKIKSQDIQNTLNKNQPSTQTITQIFLAENTKKLLEKAFLIANLNQHNYVGTEHLLASILTLKDDQIKNLFSSKEVNIWDIQNQVDSIMNSTSKFPNLSNILEDFDNSSKNYPGYDMPTPGIDTTLNTPNLNQKSALETFATKLTDEKIQQKIDPVIGREIEIERLIQILSRRNKNNPLLLGDPGVGKTAIVEGLTKKIIEGDVPDILADFKIYSLDLSMVVAGTSFRGEFENRIKQIISEVKNDPKIILFIDEIHNIIGAGSATGSMDAANILKPALARGEIRLIGATTLQDYKKHIQNDPALERRFQPIMVEEPSIEKTIKILDGIKTNYEIYHQVKIKNNAITAAAGLSSRYITDRFLPDKAIDLIDEAASKAKIKFFENPANKNVKELKNLIKNIEKEKQQAVTNEQFSSALRLKAKEEEILLNLKKIKNQGKTANQTLPEITQKEIAEIISKTTNIPLSELIVKEKTKLLNLEKKLGKKIIDQPEALNSIAKLVRRSRTGISDSSRPIGSFIFLGPSGVGKTELAKTLAETVFGSPKSLIKIDMSEFAESFNMSKLIGAPAGYVGYKEESKLTDSVKRRPYSVVLFDEIEKAHNQIFNLLLQILEDGHITDASGKIINFKNTIIIMTSNLGSSHFNQQTTLGFDENKLKSKLEKNLENIKIDVLKKLKDKFPPEFLSRVDKTVVFKPLNNQALIKISKLQLEELKSRLNSQGLTLKFDNKLPALIAKLSYNPQSGAREIRKNIQELIENKIAEKILASKKNIKTINIKIKNNKITI